MGFDQQIIYLRISHLAGKSKQSRLPCGEHMKPMISGCISNMVCVNEPLSAGFQPHSLIHLTCKKSQNTREVPSHQFFFSTQ